MQIKTIPTQAIMWLRARRLRAWTSLQVVIFLSYVSGIWHGCSGTKNLTAKICCCHIWSQRLTVPLQTQLGYHYQMCCTRHHVAIQSMYRNRHWAIPLLSKQMVRVKHKKYIEWLLSKRSYILLGPVSNWCWLDGAHFCESINQSKSDFYQFEATS